MILIKSNPIIKRFTLKFRLDEVALVDEIIEEVESTITDKEFYKAMQKLKDRGTNAVPPKKSASAYIIFGKEVRLSLTWSSIFIIFL